MYKNFAELKSCLDYDKPKTIVVAAAHDERTLEAILLAKKLFPMKYILVGKREKITEIFSKLGELVSQDIIHDSDDDTTSAKLAVSLIKAGKADILMKGVLSTEILLKAVLDKENGIRKGALMSHLAVLEIPTYHKLIGVSDGGMIPYPTFNQKVGIIENAVAFFQRLGIEKPKVAALAAVEKVSDKMPETSDAYKLQKMCESNKLLNCQLEGPLSFDLAISKEAAIIKGYQGEITGEVDILLVPNIASGNIMSKSQIYWGNAKMAGCILGAQVPIVLVSRSASAQEKKLSILLCLACE